MAGWMAGWMDGGGKGWTDGRQKEGERHTAVTHSALDGDAGTGKASTIDPSLIPTPYSLIPRPSTVNPILYSLFPIPYPLNPGHRP